jgi:UDP-N-acetylmuramyl pentapeptide synthase
MAQYDFVLCVGSEAFTYFELLSNQMEASRLHWCETHDEASKLILEITEPNDIVVVNGSEGAQMEKVVSKIVHPSDEDRVYKRG